MKPRYDFTKGKMISYDGEIIEFAGSSNIDKYEDQIAELMNLFDFKKGEYLVTDESYDNLRLWQRLTQSIYLG
jgi:hypothetical protein